jgi:hypothetical protein
MPPLVCSRAVACRSYDEAGQSNQTVTGLEHDTPTDVEG